MAATTRLGLTGTPRRPFGSFAGKGGTAGGPHPVGHLTVLAAGATPGHPYGDFSGKEATQDATGSYVERFQLLESYGSATYVDVPGASMLIGGFDAYSGTSLVLHSFSERFGLLESYSSSAQMFTSYEETLGLLESTTFSVNVGEDATTTYGEQFGLLESYTSTKAVRGSYAERFQILESYTSSEGPPNPPPLEQAGERWRVQQRRKRWKVWGRQ